MAARADQEVDRAVAWDGVVAELAEVLVVARPAGDIVVAEVVERRRLVGEAVVEQRDREVLPYRRAARYRLLGAGDQRASRRRGGRAVHLRALQGAEARVEIAAGRTVQRDVVAEDEVPAGAAVDAVARRAADKDVVAVVAADRVRAANGARTGFHAQGR